MKHLVRIIRTKHEYEEPKDKRKGNAGKGFLCPQSRYLCHKINGYWFRLSCKMWSGHMHIPESTIWTKLKNGKSVPEVLKPGR